MKVPIKFRGRRPLGEWIYGSYVKGEKYSYIIDTEHGQCIVEPESVAQLIGYDKNGEEVYSGDVLTLEDGKQVSAEWEIVFRDNKGESYYAREEILKWFQKRGR